MLQPGDLLFQDLDCYPFCEAIDKVTTGYNGANFSHIGVAVRNGERNFIVIEALPKDGVIVTQLEEFLNRSLDVKRLPKVAVGRLKENYERLIPSALIEAEALIGKNYNAIFDINNDAYYCAELIYKIFLRANKGKPIFKLQQMTFKDPTTGNTHPLWEEYFSSLGVSIPEGKLGINPGSISRSSALTIFRVYGIPTGWKRKK